MNICNEEKKERKYRLNQAGPKVVRQALRPAGLRVFVVYYG